MRVGGQRPRASSSPPDTARSGQKHKICLFSLFRLVFTLFVPYIPPNPYHTASEQNDDLNATRGARQRPTGTPHLSRGAEQQPPNGTGASGARRRAGRIGTKRRRKSKTPETAAAPDAAGRRDDENGNKRAGRRAEGQGRQRGPAAPGGGGGAGRRDGRSRRSAEVRCRRGQRSPLARPLPGARRCPGGPARRPPLVHRIGASTGPPPPGETAGDRQPRPPRRPRRRGHRRQPLHGETLPETQRPATQATARAAARAVEATGHFAKPVVNCRQHPLRFRPQGAGPLRRPLLFWRGLMRTFVYVDGFNLY